MMDNVPFLFDKASGVWSSWMISMSWQVALLVAVLAVSGFLLRSRSARFRYSMWTLVPIRLLLPPSLALMTGWGWWLLPLQTPSADTKPERNGALVDSQPVESLRSEGMSGPILQQELVQPAAIHESQMIDQGDVPRLAPSDMLVTTQSRGPTGQMTSGKPELIPRHVASNQFYSVAIRNIAFVIWLAIASILASRLIIGYRQVRRWVKNPVVADAATQSIMDECCQELGLRTGFSVRISSSIWTPLVTGLYRPVILLPPAVLPLLNARELKAVLIHELQHVVRGDFLQECVLVLVQIVYFFHPCVWFANHQLRRMREQACDEATIALLNGQRSAYGSGFVKIAELLTKPTPQFALGIADSGENVTSRLRRILDPKLRIGRGVSWSGLMLIVLLGFVLIPSSARRTAIADSKQQPTTVPETAAKQKPDRLVVVAPDDPKPPQKELSEIVTIGDDDVDPIEITGKIIDVNAKPAANSFVRFQWPAPSEQSASITADEEGRFRVRLRIKKESLPWLKVSVVSSDRSQVAYYRVPRNENAPKETISIQLAASRVAQLKVVDKSGVPIVKANAAIQLGFPQIADPAQTGADGIAKFVIPASERINAVVAWKDDAGLDYRLYALSRNQTADSSAKAPEFPENGIATLTLDGASPASVKLLDEDGVPLKNAAIYPWLLQKETESDQLNLSMFFPVFVHKTNEEGVATFPWIPSWQTGRMQFWPQATGYDRQRAIYAPGKDENPLKIVLNKLVPIKGHVRDATGAPVAGVNITAVGAGYTFDSARATGVTDKDGNYELLLSPDQIYLLIASTKGLAAAPQTGFAAFKGKPVEGKDFTLRTATRIHGRLIDDVTQQPIAGGNVFVCQYGQDLHSIDGVVLPNPEKSRNYVCPMLVHSTLTDDQGQFELFVGDGKFDIRPPQQERADKFEIAGESTREFVVKTKLSRQVELVGTVKDQATGLPLAGAVIDGVSRSHGGRDWQAKTNSDGEFRVKQFPAATYVCAFSADKKLGAILEVESNQSTVTLNLQPVGTAHGRLLKTGTKEPWGGVAVRYGVRVPDEENRTWSYRFGGSVTTAADGSFELVQLVPGWEYAMQLDSRSDGTIPGLGAVTVKPGESRQIGDVSPPPPPKPYVPPTLEEQIQSAFNVEGTAVERFLRSKDVIRLVNQHLLVVFGVPDDSGIRSLMKIRFEDKDFRSFSDEFRIMAIPTDEKRRPAAGELASQLNESLEGDHSAFLLVMLDSSARKVGKIAADQLVVDGQLSREKLFEWLRQFQMEPKDAQKLLDNALAEARQQNKRVLVQETATWCGPCLSLSRFLNSNRIWEKDYIWVKMDHRYSGAQEVMSNLRGEAQGGIPWIAILDADGTKLATSNDLKSKENIGFPSSPSERAHFEQMLKSTRLKLTDNEINELIHSLTADSK